ncbi:ABC transporter ATP-binding protein [Roseisalinus antarcticus]|uniref:Oligopeptide transport ATP-binding protein OppD n=1 Tax=Roseisalinus antarcticus TaxID=254357 RepID=A0A1Y5TUK0_9RHOB|nr:ABC transporter ATP-binding protein [Roseisalinus antarcticus]SLN72172.1 Oligopeptide transport ATP-binding protein OppD [Roseisalinus antarcticus]
MTALLQIDDLSVSFRVGGAELHAVIDVSLAVRAGERVGVIGESGSGKSVMARSILRLDDPRRTRYGAGSAISLDGQQVLTLPDAGLRRLRGQTASMIFQNPMHSLNPAFTIGNQLDAVLRAHRPDSRAERHRRILAMLTDVDLPGPEDLVNRYPHELSGGQRQRVMVAQAVLCEPALVIADEPTSALDVTAQDSVLEVLGRLNRDRGIAVLMITHDMGVVARFCEKVNVMYGGRLVESGSVDRIFAAPEHPYTVGLLDATPNPAAPLKDLVAVQGTQATRRGTVSSACAFIDRCPLATEVCGTAPPLRRLPDGHHVACHHAGPDSPGRA